MIDEAMNKGLRQGNSVGQIALSEFILKNYGNELPPTLKTLLEKVLVDEYDRMGAYFDMAAEDVALKVSNIMDGINRQ